MAERCAGWLAATLVCGALARTPAPGDTGETGETGDTGTDTGDTDTDTGDTGSDTGDTGTDTGDTGSDTGDTDTDTGDTDTDTEGDTGCALFTECMSDSVCQASACAPTQPLAAGAIDTSGRISCVADATADMGIADVTLCYRDDVSTCGPATCEVLGSMHVVTASGTSADPWPAEPQVVITHTFMATAIVPAQADWIVGGNTFCTFTYQTDTPLTATYTYSLDTLGVLTLDSFDLTNFDDSLPGCGELGDIHDATRQLARDIIRNEIYGYAYDQRVPIRDALAP